jgi:hypothetical protein
MDRMRKIEISEGRFILYNGAFFVKRCDNHIVWTSARQDALVMSDAEADEILIKTNNFLQSGS